MNNLLLSTIPKMKDQCLKDMVLMAYCRDNPYNLIKYDDAECDGECLADDCDAIAEQLKKEQA